jgi:hypothetical protein
MASFGSDPYGERILQFCEVAEEAHAFAPAAPRNDLPTPRLIKLDELRRLLVGVAVTCGALEGLGYGRATDLPGLAAAILRDAERARPGLLEEKLARARARHRVVG